MNENIENIGNIENKATKLINSLTAENTKLKQDIETVLEINTKLNRENKLILNELAYMQEHCADLENENNRLEDIIYDLETQIADTNDDLEIQLERQEQFYYEMQSLEMEDF